MKLAKLIMFSLLSLSSLLQFETQTKTIIWDLDGVIFKTDKKAIAYNIGITNFIKYILIDRKNPFIEPLLFRTLEEFGGKQNGEKSCLISNHYGEPLPKIMCDWLIGAQHSSEILPKLLNFINTNQNKLFSSFTEKKIIEETIKSIFDINIFNQHTVINKNGLKLLKECAANKEHKLIVLSNRDKESFELLKQTNKEIFEIFEDSHIIISAHVGLAKPNPNIYKHVLDKFKLDPRECIFIDDQLINVESAKMLGIRGIHVKDNNFKKVRKKLKRLNIIK